MAEFKFPCPHCKQHIQCDAAYVGSEIACPSCQQTIVFPPAPAVAAAGPDSVHIKKSTLRNAVLIGAGVLLLAGLIAGGLYLFGGTRKLTFKAYVDGTDIVKLSGRKVWIEHLEWQQPTKMTINGAKWNPVWSENQSPTFPSWSKNTSDPYYLGLFSNLGNPKNIKVTKRLGRGTVTIIERPSAENQETLAVQVDDGPFGGADWYEFTVTW